MFQFVILLFWFGAILLGGWLLVRAVFRLTDSENILVGAAVGIIVEIVLAAILCRWISVPVGFYVCAAIVLLLGVLAAWKQKYLAGIEYSTIPADHSLLVDHCAHVLLSTRNGNF